MNHQRKKMYIFILITYWLELENYSFVLKMTEIIQEKLELKSVRSNAFKAI